MTVLKQVKILQYAVCHQDHVWETVLLKSCKINNKKTGINHLCIDENAIVLEYHNMW